jgi:hypothetical protein
MQKIGFPTLAIILFTGTALYAAPILANDGYTREMKGQPGEAAETSQGMSKDMARRTVGPHTIMLRSSLESALEQLRGLRTQIEVAQKTPVTEFEKHYKFHGVEIQKDLKMAQSQEQQLKGVVRQFPAIANSKDFREFENSFTQLWDLNQTWQSKLSDAGYWKNRSQVNSDIENLQKQINTTIEKNKTFNQSELDIMYVG